MKKLLTTMMGCCLSLSLMAQKEAPAPIAPLPTTHQVAWQQLETYAFIHFGPNTFGDREWGYGDADPMSFNPKKLDTEQWAKTIKEAGMKGVILTAKHHDGFCLWPTKYTDYSVRNTPYKDGKGDIVGELAAACKKYGLKLGLYLSPWDRHQAFYSTPLYVEYFYAQLEELLTQYGEIFEVWFDGANGGDGWYGGAKETRKIDRRTYYDFPRAHKLVYKHQPQAIIFSDGGPGCRWVGNENGYADATNWSFLRIKEVYPGYDKYYELTSGHADGDTWVPSECNTSIRPGWFYHESEDSRVKSIEQLTDLYYRSVGHNGTFLLNFPVDKDGLIHPIDSANAVDYHKQVVAELSNNLVFSSGTVIRIISIGILPAIFEELLFRKFLIDRTIRHGEFISCAMSGIMFGLWHGNFQQFFFAFFIGVLFAFVYIRTGNIIYTMIMHASMNLVTSTVTVELFNALMKSMGIDMATGNINTNIDDSVIIKSVLPMLLLLLLWIGLLVSFQIVGFIMLIVKRKKFKLAVMPGEPARKAILHSMTHSVEMWIFFSFALLLFVYQYIPDIIATIIELNGK